MIHSLSMVCPRKILINFSKTRGIKCRLKKTVHEKPIHILWFFLLTIHFVHCSIQIPLLQFISFFNTFNIRHVYIY